LSIKTFYLLNVSKLQRSYLVAKEKKEYDKFWYHRSFFHYLWNKDMKLYELGLCLGPRFLFIVIEQIEKNKK
jgi:hypothetical protein